MVRPQYRGNAATNRTSFDYDNDVLARRTRRVDNAAVTNDFSYNGRSQLTSALMGTNVFGYAYDPIGNRTVATNNGCATDYQANQLNQYSLITDHCTLITNAPTCDLDGNLLTCGAWMFAWDGENRLVLASNGATVAGFAYDHMGRRIAKISGGATNRFLYDGWAMIREIIPNDQSPMTNNFVYGLDLSGSLQGAGTIGGLVAAALGGTNVFYCYDANGNVTELADTNGTIVAAYAYDPYGIAITQTGALADANPFRFSSKYLDTETDLYYYGFRYYSPSLGRWMSRDPIGMAGGKNLYGFVLNRPTDLFDPFGEDWSTPDRKRHVRAEITCECGDSVEDLEAKGIIAFDFAEYSKWLKPEDTKPLLAPISKKATEHRVFSVPNTIYLGWGKRTSLEYFAFWPAYPFVALQKAAWIGSGFKVVYDDDINYGEMSSYLGDPNVHGVSYWGHGGSFSLSPLGAPSPVLGYGYMEPYHARPLLDHGLWFLLHHGCDSAVYMALGKTWGELVAAKGTFGGHTGSTTPWTMLTGMSYYNGMYTP